MQNTLPREEGETFVQWMERWCDDAVLRVTPAEQCGMTPTQYQQAEALYLYGDLSGRE